MYVQTLSKNLQVVGVRTPNLGFDLYCSAQSLVTNSYRPDKCWCIRKTTGCQNAVPSLSFPSNLDVTGFQLTQLLLNDSSIV